MSIAEILKPHVFFFLHLMSGFWFMFNALFDVLPLHIRYWVDTSTIVKGLFGNGETPEVMTSLLYAQNNVGYVWYIMSFVAVVSAIGLMFYAIWMKRLLAK